MKLVFNIFLFFNTSANALMGISLTFNESQNKEVLVVYSALTKELSIPKELIHLKKVENDPCDIFKESIWQICLWNGELFYPQMDREVLMNSYSIFWKKTE